MIGRDKVHTTAVIIQPPPEFWGPIQAIRQKYDKAYDRWMPHINLLYPFLPHEALDDAAKTLTQALSTLAPFDLAFNGFGRFDQGASNTIWLRPTDNPSGSIVALQKKLEEAFPIL
eukprot:TRINITY_DN7082_c0_g1_i1.p1 TRINITY_DN7082_c0_g1~~TRINITY_DN7082_c0_g1_i1.p1  ORF type:complete len:116 (-),score=25.39 TRINITY_DN7082_c0_g1_i1:100-447(-)